MSVHTSLTTASNSELQAIISRPTRTPVACLNCRKSKIKCFHTGIPPCRHCSNTKKECVIPSIIQTDEQPTPKRRAPTSQVQGTTPTFKKLRYDANGTGLPVEEVLREAIDVFYAHFYNDIFAFIHRPSFTKLFNERPQDIDPALLLAMLTLSARFCRSVLKDFESEAAASEYFCKRTLALLMPKVDSPSIVRIQAFLMVGLHLWGSMQGPAAWIYVGIAIRMAQVRDLGSEQSYPHLDPASPNFTSEWIMSEERRRTFWSCYMLDRYLSNGRGRPQTIQNKDITIHLPADNINFTFGTPEATRFLNQPLAEGQTTLPECTGTMASMVELVDLWSRMAKWSCARAWTTDPVAPWDGRSEFNQVCSKLEEWRAQRPKSLQMHDHTLMIQLSQKNTNWSLMWMIYYNGLLFMHRSYLPFAPTKQDPKGPREAAERGWQEPEGFWKNSAHTCFDAAERIVSLNETLRSQENTLVTPIALFSLFSAASMLIYLVEFPWMDPIIAPRALDLYKICIDYLKSVQTTWRMVDNWVETLSKLSEVHHRFAKEGRSTQQTTDHFAEYRTRVLDFGSLTTQLDTSYPRNPREIYSSVRTDVPEDSHASLGASTNSVAQRTKARHETAPITVLPYADHYVPLETLPIQSIHEGSLLAFMQGNNWDFYNDDWMNNIDAILDVPPSEHTRQQSYDPIAPPEQFASST
ncbi:Putative uncharacterized protein [Taphrina deformans PYCC 5710]|uniref:Zn(2)-C6 fungal-type domain-containing protein n=1 Tax=Taphrina deformans (strain PYCC 5710 / ATCC 11124 / CBS 356.35 / IMI 108563 / JCM 9778 / NBRC 8474) TaxID=1097556 RepID=R4XB55_TAPDE|nr:Putative uncharacterized protein [Taphrina deformans PYCC 5710]|eukprot:CCG83058.1 Putative uncharacterized protein [Taphrina deformans PYCC 5710]